MQVKPVDFEHAQLFVNDSMKFKFCLKATPLLMANS